MSGVAPWYGAKRAPALRRRIVAEIGHAHRGYFEGCCGSLAVLMSMRPVSMEMAVDLNGDLINLARVLASARWEDLCALVARTLVCSELYAECRDRWSDESESIVAPSIDAVDEAHVAAAYRFVVASWQGINGVSGTGRGNCQLARRYTVGGGHGATRWRGVANSMPAWHERLRSVLIDRLDVCEAVSRLADDGTWAVYIDPPYWRKGDTYVHDFTPEKHAQLADVLAAKKRTRVCVSYYDEPEVRELYLPRGWTLVDCATTKALVNQGMREKQGERVKAPEILLINGPSFTAGGLFSDAEGDA